MQDAEVIGAVLRTRMGVAPVYVSIGHRISLEGAIRFVLACTPRYRLPETTRWAHRLASAAQPEPCPGGAEMKRRPEGPPPRDDGSVPAT
jgi:deoxyribonuclease V